MIAGSFSNIDQPVASGTVPYEPKRLHELKIEEQFLCDVRSGGKKAEIRKNDRDYKIGDYLLLAHREDKALTKVTHILTRDDFHDLPENYVILSIELILIY